LLRQQFILQNTNSAKRISFDRVEIRYKEELVYLEKQCAGFGAVEVKDMFTKYLTVFVLLYVLFFCVTPASGQEQSFNLISFLGENATKVSDLLIEKFKAKKKPCLESKKNHVGIKRLLTDENCRVFQFDNNLLLSVAFDNKSLVIQKITISLKAKVFSPRDFGLPVELERMNQYEKKELEKNIVMKKNCAFDNTYCYVEVQEDNLKDDTKKGGFDTILKSEAELNTILSDAGRFFRQGLLNLIDNRRPQAQKDFDKSVETFMLPNATHPKLDACFNALVENIYRLEFPKNGHSLEIENLATLCNWEVSKNTVEAITKLKTPQQNANSGLVVTVIDSTKQGFTEQNFEPLESDDLSRFLAVMVGPRPKQLPNGSYPIVIKWFDDNLNDPYSMKIVNWGTLFMGETNSDEYWIIRVTIRAKNLYGAYVLREYRFSIRQNRIIKYTVS
jgi:hypothetical protein